MSLSSDLGRAFFASKLKLSLVLSLIVEINYGDNFYIDIYKLIVEGENFLDIYSFNNRGKKSGIFLGNKNDVVKLKKDIHLSYLSQRLLFPFPLELVTDRATENLFVIEEIINRRTHLF